MTLREREHIKTNRSHTASLAQIEKLSCPAPLGGFLASHRTCGYDQLSQFKSGVPMKRLFYNVLFIATSLIYVTSASSLFGQETKPDETKNASEEQPEFSGPQAGEQLPELKITVFAQDGSEKSVNISQQFKDDPLVIFFVHEVTRPSIGLTRTLVEYAAKREQDGLHTAVVFLTDDPTETAAWMRRAASALPKIANLGISPEGIEGPGAYGLNRKMQLTVVVAKDSKVTANFAIVQPSLAADSLAIATAIATTLGDKQPPTADQLGKQTGEMKKGEMDDGEFRALLAPVISKSATPAEIDAAAAKVESAAQENPALRKRIHEVANRIIDAGKLENYGNVTSQTYLKKWAMEFGEKTEAKE
jgi:hypothetical protein